MRPIDTIHKRLQLDDGLHSPYMARFLNWWANKDPAARNALPSREVHGVVLPYSGEQIAERLITNLQVAESYYVGADVMELLRELSPEMPPEALHKDDPPSTHGFLLFEKPYMLTDINVKQMPIRAIMWSSEIVGKEHQGQMYGIVIWALVDFDDKEVDDHYREHDAGKLVDSLVKNGIRFTPATVFSTSYGGYSFELADRTGTVLAAEAEDVSLTREPDGAWRVQSGRDATDLLNGRTARGLNERVRPDPLVTFLQTLWRFQQQEIAAREPLHTPRSQYKHLVYRRMNLSPVSVIHLRKRAQGEESGGREFEYSHRFIVRGHWRRQWYASEQRHKSIFIRPHVKGPENAPFLARDHVTAIVR